ncbi:MATE family efflux transporter [Campylobacter sp. MIT 12-8780]|uniref:MATE family efflux transporter n=1 Tax=unclassified Campylobacter TaxID=2593542 RepID=UPI00115D84CA|nr:MULTISPECIES: MATE family efflux transporter [unclassified Campylobacter]NDJ28162.1 MATE family efflux transporter [Campylobacter sp. MIT 19-121]TQR42018.1 MATE family efflux transporter [Campylobacter sp. MIT 12-8780]
MPKKQLSLKQLSVPIFLEMFLRYLTIIINTYMVTQYSNYLIGALGAGNQILSIFITIFSFLSVGCSVVIAQALGAKDYELVSKSIHQSLFLNSLLGVVCASFILLQGDFLLDLMNVPQELLTPSRIYLHLLGICLFFDALAAVLAAIIRVYNLAYWVMYATLIMNVCTIGINYYVLYYTSLELFGVGISTIIGRLLVIIILAFVFFSKINFKFNIKTMIFLDFSVLKKILKIGLFSAGENLIWIVQYTIAFSFVASLGASNLSVQTIYFQISMFVMLTGQAISVANEIIIGKLVGANFLNVAYKHTWKAFYISIIATLSVVLVFYFLQGFIMQKLGLNDELKALMQPLFLLSLFLEPSRTFNIVMVNSLRASGDARFPFIMACIFMLGVSLPVAYGLCFYAQLGILGVWIGFLCDEFLRGLSNAWRWKSKKWQGKAVV